MTCFIELAALLLLHLKQVIRALLRHHELDESKRLMIYDLQFAMALSDLSVLAGPVLTYQIEYFVSYRYERAVDSDV